VSVVFSGVVLTTNGSATYSCVASGESDFVNTPTTKRITSAKKDIPGTTGNRAIPHLLQPTHSQLLATISINLFCALYNSASAPLGTLHLQTTRALFSTTNPCTENGAVTDTACTVIVPAIPMCYQKPS